MKKIWIGLAIFFVVAGVAGMIADSGSTKKKAEEMRNYPVISRQDLDSYMSQSPAQEMIVTDISPVGTLVQDTQGGIEGSFYYLYAKGERYPEEDGLGDKVDRDSNWMESEDLSYQVKAEDLTTDLGNGVEVSNDSVYGLPELTTYYPNGEGNYEGNTRYVYYGLQEGDTLSAVMTVGDGKADIHPMLSYMEDRYYVYGGADAMIQFIDNYVEADSAAFVVVGVVLALICLAIGYFIPSGRSIRINAKNAGKNAKSGWQEYRELDAGLKVRFWLFKLIGVCGIVGGLAIIVKGNESLALITLGTIVLIAGGASWYMSSPHSYEKSNDMIKMIAFNQPTTIEKIYDAYKELDTPLGSPYLAKMKTMRQKALIFGPDDSGQYLYFWLNDKGNLGYLGYTFLEWAIKQPLTQPIKPYNPYSGSDIAEKLCISSDIMLLQKQLFENIKNYRKTGEVLPIQGSNPSEVYTFTEDFKLTGQQFDLQDSKGNVIYHVEGTMPLRTFHIFDQVGNEVFKVTKEVLNAIPTYRFYQNGEMIGILEKQFTLAKDRFQMDIAEGTLKLEEYAGSIGYNYLVSLNDKPIGAVMDDLELRLDNLIFDNSVVIVYEKKYLAMITALAIMVAREIARDEE
ncbi:MAG: hypothetical protein V8R67_05445 [Eubacterium sp.]